MVTTPLVSVVIAARNAAAHLAETLASATAQSWPRIEIILVDDGSDDQTAAVAAQFVPRIRYERRSHQGLAAARNEGIRLATGDYIALLDADDLWHPDKIATQVAIAALNPESGLIACDAEEFRDGKTVRPHLFHAAAAAVRTAPGRQLTGDFQRAFIRSQLIACPAQVLMPRRVVDRIGRFVDSGAQDYDYYLRISLHYPVTLHADVLTRWRYSPNSMSGPDPDRKLRWGFDALPILVAHRQRCRAEDRGELERRIRRQVFSLGKMLMRQGRVADRRSATGALLKLLSAYPWPPATLVHLMGLWAPEPIYRIADPGRRRAEQ